MAFRLPETMNCVSIKVRFRSCVLYFASLHFLGLCSSAFSRSSGWVVGQSRGAWNYNFGREGVEKKKSHWRAIISGFDFWRVLTRATWDWKWSRRRLWKTRIVEQRHCHGGCIHSTSMGEDQRRRRHNSHSYLSHHRSEVTSV